MYMKTLHYTFKYVQLLTVNNLPPMQKTGEGNGTPLQYSCLENPMDGGTW